MSRLHDIDLASLADVIDDPFERREVMRAVEAAGDDNLSHEDVALLTEHALPLLLLDNYELTTVLAVLGVPAAIARRLG